MSFTLQVADRNYNSFTINRLNDADIPPINPIEHKLLNQDIFDYHAISRTVTIRHSTTREMSNIPGVLVLEGNKRYGKHKRKFLYKCIPDDRRLPVFMVPYLIRMEFNKRQYNKYVIFKFNNWESKHPRGLLVQTLGNVTELPNFYEYQLYCKSLYSPIQIFKKAAMQSLKTKTETEYIGYIQSNYINVEDRRRWDVITIDPLTSKDFDDAFGVRELEDNTCMISIYISNVSFWMDSLGLWDSFSKRVSTIYLPDRKRPMLPNILSDSLCSLQEGCSRFAFTLDLIVDKYDWSIKNHSFKNTCICVRKNLRYDTVEQQEDNAFKKCLYYAKRMNRVGKYIDNIANCHDLIAYLMILMNYLSATHLKKHKVGIFRSAKFNSEFIAPNNVPTDVQKFLRMWNSLGGQYVKYEDIERHDMLNLDAYVHITSPIRRLVDLLNIIIIQDSLGLLPLTGDRLSFVEKWTNPSSFAYINQTMKSIRKVQNNCSLLNICSTELLEKIHEGFIFDKIRSDDKSYKYMVYFPEFKMVNQFISTLDKDFLSQQKFKLYIFMDENQLKQKIRIEIQ
uniref:RNB domain-containing protein n=1 Tax=viral metagenome TaxID=1070528 RepID=A0A6C0C5P3_9ZZZZ